MHLNTLKLLHCAGNGPHDLQLFLAHSAPFIPKAVFIIFPGHFLRIPLRQMIYERDNCHRCTSFVHAAKYFLISCTSLLMSCFLTATFNYVLTDRTFLEQLRFGFSFSKQFLLSLIPHPSARPSSRLYSPINCADSCNEPETCSRIINLLILYVISVHYLHYTSHSLLKNLGIIHLEMLHLKIKNFQVVSIEKYRPFIFNCSTQTLIQL